MRSTSLTVGTGISPGPMPLLGTVVNNHLLCLFPPFQAVSWPVCADQANKLKQLSNLLVSWLSEIIIFCELLSIVLLTVSYIFIFVSDGRVNHICISSWLEGEVYPLFQKCWILLCGSPIAYLANSLLLDLYGLNFRGKYNYRREFESVTIESKGKCVHDSGISRFLSTGRYCTIFAFPSSNIWKWIPFRGLRIYTKRKKSSASNEYLTRFHSYLTLLTVLWHKNKISQGWVCL